MPVETPTTQNAFALLTDSLREEVSLTTVRLSPFRLLVSGTYHLSCADEQMSLVDPCNEPL